MAYIRVTFAHKPQNANPFAFINSFCRKFLAVSFILMTNDNRTQLAFWGKCALRIAEFGLHLSANNGHLSGSWAFIRIKLVYLCAYYHPM